MKLMCNSGFVSLHYSVAPCIGLVSYVHGRDTVKVMPAEMHLGGHKEKTVIEKSGSPVY